MFYLWPKGGDVFSRLAPRGRVVILWLCGFVDRRSLVVARGSWLLSLLPWIVAMVVDGGEMCALGQGVESGVVIRGGDMRCLKVELMGGRWYVRW